MRLVFVGKGNHYEVQSPLELFVADKSIEEGLHFEGGDSDKSSVFFGKLVLQIVADILDFFERGLEARRKPINEDPKL